MQHATQKRPRGRPSKQATADLKSAILDGAIRLFAERGFEAVYIKDIARTTGVAPSLVHHHFGTREGLRSACRDYVIVQIRETLADYENMVPDDGTTDLISMYGTAVRAGLGDRPHLLRFLAVTLMEPHEDSRALFQDYYDIFHKLTTRSVASGFLRDDVDPRWLTLHAIYLQLGTAFLYDTLAHSFGEDPYSSAESTERTKAFGEIAKDGVLRQKG